MVLFFIIGRIAVAGSDYEGRSNVLLKFNSTANFRMFQVQVSLIDDNDFTGNKEFNGTLTFVSSMERPSVPVIISPDNALATIVEDESMFCKISLMCQSGYTCMIPAYLLFPIHLLDHRYCRLTWIRNASVYP